MDPKKIPKKRSVPCTLARSIHESSRIYHVPLTYRIHYYHPNNTPSPSISALAETPRILSMTDLTSVAFLLSAAVISLHHVHDLRQHGVKASYEAASA